MVKTKQEVTTSADDGQSASNSFRQLHAKKKAPGPVSPEKKYNQLHFRTQYAVQI